MSKDFRDENSGIIPETIPEGIDPLDVETKICPIKKGPQGENVSCSSFCGFYIKDANQCAIVEIAINSGNIDAELEDITKQFTQLVDEYING